MKALSVVFLALGLMACGHPGSSSSQVTEKPHYGPELMPTPTATPASMSQADMKKQALVAAIILVIKARASAKVPN